MKRSLIALALFASVGCAFAGADEIDKNVGECYAYMMRANRFDGMKIVSRYAINGRLALAYARESLRDGDVYSQVRGCNEIGINVKEFMPRESKTKKMG